MGNLWQKGYGYRVRYGYPKTGYYDNESIQSKDLFLQGRRGLWAEFPVEG